MVSFDTVAKHTFTVDEAHSMDKGEWTKAMDVPRLLRCVFFGDVTALEGLRNLVKSLQVMDFTG